MKAEAQREGHVSTGQRLEWCVSKLRFARGCRRPPESGIDKEGLSLRAFGETMAGDTLP